MTMALIGESRLDKEIFHLATAKTTSTCLAGSQWGCSGVSLDELHGAENSENGV